jgi:hypothetical protein
MAGARLGEAHKLPEVGSHSAYLAVRRRRRHLDGPVVEAVVVGGGRPGTVLAEVKTVRSLYAAKTFGLRLRIMCDGNHWTLNQLRRRE